MGYEIRDEVLLDILRAEHAKVNGERRGYPTKPSLDTNEVARRYADAYRNRYAESPSFPAGPQTSSLQSKLRARLQALADEGKIDVERKFHGYAWWAAEYGPALVEYLASEDLELHGGIEGLAADAEYVSSLFLKQVDALLAKVRAGDHDAIRTLSNACFRVPEAVGSEWRPDDRGKS